MIEALMAILDPDQSTDLPTKVLLVDDEKEFIDTLAERLDTRGISAKVVYSGEEALPVIKSDPPEVVLLDLKMPGMDGMDVLRKIKHEHPITEVIIYTGHGGDVEKELSRELGVFAYLQKPVDIGVLTDTMKAAYKKMKRVSEI
jgi:DNA-binding response OmpR family regulator